MKKYIPAFVMLSAIGITLSCTPKEDPGKEDPHKQDPRVEVVEVTVSQDSATLEVGSGISLTASVIPPDATDRVITWSSSNAGVASVSGGYVLAVSDGKATITASAGGKSASCEVTVLPRNVEPTGVSFDQTEITIYVGNTLQLSATVSPSDATDKSLSWSSSDTAVAQVSDSGLVTAVAPGSATVTVSTINGISASVTVSVLINGQNEDYGYEDL